jgi:hypothetical protein
MVTSESIRRVLKRAGGQLIGGETAAVFARHRSAARAAFRAISRIRRVTPPTDRRDWIPFIRQHSDLVKFNQANGKTTVTVNMAAAKGEVSQ